MVSKYPCENEENVLLLTVQKHYLSSEAGMPAPWIGQMGQEIAGDCSFEYQSWVPVWKQAAEIPPSGQGSRHATYRDKSRESSNAAGGLQPGRSPCVLVVEDNEGDVFIIQEALREHAVQCEVSVVSDGESALRLFDELDNAADEPCPELVLLDLNLPRKSGHAVLERIRHSERCAGIPVVIVTSSDSQRDLAENQRLGATAYFRKPSSLEQFLDIGKLVKDLLPTH